MSHSSAQRELLDTLGACLEGNPQLFKAQSVKPKKPTPSSITNTSESRHLEENVSDQSDQLSSNFQTMSLKKKKSYLMHP